ncbi:MAG TPA: DUF2520 domain-containing protein [Ferruginibacter sp.]|nr:DUF2520 domain-containing protein [Ferruginibacter sp.]HRE65180.1 DUF2520 domain-containing protein [Ferruginibacter sp.]
MKISLIGSGNVASVLGRLIVKSGHHNISQVISRDLEHAQQLAQELGAAAGDFSSVADQSADLFIIAISDTALESFFVKGDIQKKCVVHTAGSVGIDILAQYSNFYGVLYPLQSLRKEIKEVPTIPFLVDGNNQESLNYIETFAKSISPIVSRSTDEERLKLHAAAVIVSNFTNHLYSIAEDFCQKENVPFETLKPLILETANRIQEFSPAKVQTGPAIRKDIHTLDKHLRLFTAHPKLRTMYLRLTDSIMNP